MNLSILEASGSCSFHSMDSPDLPKRSLLGWLNQEAERNRCTQGLLPRSWSEGDPIYALTMIRLLQTFMILSSNPCPYYHNAALVFPPLATQLEQPDFSQQAPPAGHTPYRKRHSHGGTAHLPRQFGPPPSPSPSPPGLLGAAHAGPCEARSFLTTRTRIHGAEAQGSGRRGVAVEQGSGRRAAHAANAPQSLPPSAPRGGQARRTAAEARRGAARRGQVPSFVAVLLSVSFVLVFGEIIPQARPPPPADSRAAATVARENHSHENSESCRLSDE
jgi:hypothetical protein